MMRTGRGFLPSPRFAFPCPKPVCRHHVGTGSTDSIDEPRQCRLLVQPVTLGHQVGVDLQRYLRATVAHLGAHIQWPLAEREQQAGVEVPQVVPRGVPQASATANGSVDDHCVEVEVQHQAIRLNGLEWCVRRDHSSFHLRTKLHLRCLWPVGIVDEV